MSGLGLHVTVGVIAMESSMQTLSLPSGHDVTLNIGLGCGSALPKLPVPSRIRVWARVLPVVMEPGYIANMVLVPSRVWFGEPLLIVQGTFKPDVHRHDTLWQAVIASGQDCIAYYSHELLAGCLFGPKSDEWGGFNINLFSFLGDKHD